MTVERLQKVLAQAGLGSRRACDELIRQGRVQVDGQPAVLGCKVDPRTAEITVDGEPLPGAEATRYVAMCKPAGVLSVMQDERGRPALSALVPVQERLYPVGRLDLDSEGLVLLTNDGGLANRLTHPRYGHPKEYLVLVEGEPDRRALTRLRRGIAVEGRRTCPAHVQIVTKPPDDVRIPVVASEQSATWLRFTLREGRKRQIRHMCSAIGHQVLRLIRVGIGPLRLGSLKPGEWRDLTAREVRDLKKLG